MQLFRDVEIPLKRFRLLMHNQSVNQVDLLDGSTASLVDYYDRGINGGNDRRDYQSSKIWLCYKKVTSKF
jgi:hypothetical protein